MPAAVRYFGIRHHGPGSARRLLEALEAERPAEVLIEGPADLTELLALLAAAQMRPPVALLAYPADRPAEATFWPFAVFSPEYQAARWGLDNGIPVRFIDLPVSRRLPTDAPEDEPAEEAPQPADASPQPADAPPQPENASPQPEDSDAVARPTVAHDPIGALARAAGYEDGESWWRDVIEENPEPGPIFAAVADAMGALREDRPPPDPLEAAREAHMRIEIAKSTKAIDGTLAVVCGAWHVPALKAKHTLKDDRALLKGLPRQKITATWTPWTAPRLATSRGYGAGVDAPGWNRHLWDTPPAELSTRWITRIARALRAEGRMVSTASLIETERLAVALAALRERPRPGFEELREAAVACLCDGNALVWETIAEALLIGAEVGSIPDDVPRAPLLEDLQRQQRKTGLKPQALERELALDLRSQAGLLRSTLLHRLHALDCPWGRLQDPGRSRGTFRERWLLRWEPDYAVALVEHLVYGPTIAQAAAGRTQARMQQATTLAALSALVFTALTAQLPAAAATGVARLSALAGQSSDCGDMLSALPELADVLRYGEARAIDTAQLQALFARIAIQGTLALPYAARGLDAEAGQALRRQLQSSDRALRLVETQEPLELWHRTLHQVAHDPRVARLVSGQAARLLYEADQLSSDAAVALLARMLSPGTPIADAAAFFEGFLEGAGSRLIHDRPLRHCVDAWLKGLDEDAFIESLPLLRRVFANMDPSERKYLLDALLGRQASQAGVAVLADADARWDRQFAIVTTILKGQPHG